MDAPPVQYLRTPDGFDIAYTSVGSGYPILQSPSGFSHFIRMSRLLTRGGPPSFLVIDARP
jgi:hypothetical protein